MPYIQIRARFALCVLAGLAWASGSTLLAVPWITDLGQLISLPLASSLTRLVSRYVSSPDAVAAIAGAVMVRNSRDSRLTRLQEWDYFLGIASIKRSQGLRQSTLVAQGAFSIYEAAATGNFAIVGPMTLIMIPINLLLSLVMYRIQRGVFVEMGMRVRHNPRGFLMYIFLYQALMSPLAVYGYTQNLLRRKRRW